MRYNDLDLELLRCFAIVAECKSFTLAGERLGRSQSAISIRINKLEELVGSPLLDRNSRKVTLTERGALLLPKAHALLESGEELLASLRAPELSGTLRIGFLEYLAPQRIPEIFAQIRRRLPAAKLKFHIGLSRYLLGLLDRDEIDIAIAMHNPDRNDAEPLAREQLIWVQGQREIDFTTSDGWPLCLLEAPCFYRSSALEALTLNALPHSEVVQSNNIFAIRSAVSSGLGLSVMGRSSLGNGIHEVDSRSNLPQLPTMGISIYGKDERKELFANVLRETLRDYVTLR